MEEELAWTGCAGRRCTGWSRASANLDSATLLEYSLEYSIQDGPVGAVGRVFGVDTIGLGGLDVVGVVVEEADGILGDCKFTAQGPDLRVFVAKDIGAFGATRAIGVVGLRSWLEGGESEFVCSRIQSAGRTRQLGSR